MSTLLMSHFDLTSRGITLKILKNLFCLLLGFFVFFFFVNNISNVFHKTLVNNRFLSFVVSKILPLKNRNFSVISIPSTTNFSLERVITSSMRSSPYITWLSLDRQHAMMYTSGTSTFDCTEVDIPFKIQIALNI